MSNWTATLFIFSLSLSEKYSVLDFTWKAESVIAPQRQRTAAIQSVKLRGKRWLDKNDRYYIYHFWSTASSQATVQNTNQTSLVSTDLGEKKLERWNTYQLGSWLWHNTLFQVKARLFTPVLLCFLSLPLCILHQCGYSYCSCSSTTWGTDG